MIYSVIIDSAAKLDLIETISWYNKQKQGLGNQFYKNIWETIKLIKSDPHMFQLRYKTLRALPLKKFPFIILYHIDEDKKLVAVTAILHSSRNPEIWKKRT